MCMIVDAGNMNAVMAASYLWHNETCSYLLFMLLMPGASTTSHSRGQLEISRQQRTLLDSYRVKVV